MRATMCAGDVRASLAGVPHVPHVPSVAHMTDMADMTNMAHVSYVADMSVWAMAEERRDDEKASREDGAAEKDE
jgi:hypothetical protein